jgi:acyl-CoA synthetase (AMP-forming)/AMP-acid ligase II
MNPEGERLTGQGLTYADVRLVDAIPKSPAGKILRRLLG